MSVISKNLDNISAGLDRLFNWIGGGFEVCSGGHKFQDTRNKWIVIDKNTKDTVGYEVFKCTKCGVEERRNQVQHRVEERRLFAKWKLPECLQF